MHQDANAHELTNLASQSREQLIARETLRTSHRHAEAYP